jgi:hypothetical protein
MVAAQRRLAQARRQRQLDETEHLNQLLGREQDHGGSQKSKTEGKNAVASSSSSVSNDGGEEENWRKVLDEASSMSLDNDLLAVMPEQPQLLLEVMNHDSVKAHSVLGAALVVSFVSMLG